MDTTRSARSHGEKIISGAERTRYPADRCCEAPNCATRLSRYNPAATCCRHDGWELKTARPKRTPAESAAPPDWVVWVMTGGRSEDAD